MECMEDSMGVNSEFRTMIGLQVGSLVAFIVSGALFAVLTRPYIMELLPANEWSPILGWIIAGVGGYIAGGILSGVVAMVLFYIIVSDW